MDDYALRQFEHGGLTLVVRQYGRPRAQSAARPFVLVHGIGASSRYFARLSRRLREHGVAYAVDLPGFGAAPRPSAPASIEDLGVLLGAFVREWALDNPVLVGHSMGTQVVTETLVQDADVSDRLVLIAPVIDPKAPTAIHQGIRLLRDSLAESPRANWIVATDYVRCGPRWYASELPAMLAYPIEERLSRLEAATLIIRGSLDPVAPGDWVRRLANATPRATLLEVPRAAHVVQYEAADVVAAAIVAHSAVAVPDLGPEVGPEP